jgi:hypothetical protein
MSGGHIGLSTGGSAQRQLWPRVAAWLSAHDPVVQPHNDATQPHHKMTRPHKTATQAHKKRKARP